MQTVVSFIFLILIISPILSYDQKLLSQIEDIKSLHKISARQSPCMVCTIIIVMIGTYFVFFKKR